MRQGPAGPFGMRQQLHPRRAGWKVGAHALQPMRHQRRQVHAQQRQRRPGILARLLAR